MEKRTIFHVIAATFCIFLLSFVSPVMARSFTLSNEDLLSLDWYLDACSPNDPNVARIIAKRDIHGKGIEFDISFPKAKKEATQTYTVSYVSSKRGGQGTLAGIDVNDYNAFALEFTLVAVDGNSSPGTGGMLVVGALIDIGYSWGYRPECISFAENEKSMVVSSTKTDTDKISVIGFTVHKLSPDGWNPNGSKVTLRVSAAPGAEILP